MPKKISCITCNGLGYVRVKRDSIADALCPDCHGRSAMDNSINCSKCHNEGTTKQIVPSVHIEDCPVCGGQGEVDG